MSWFEDIRTKFILDFIEKGRWHYITDGLKITILVTAGALVIGLVIGILIAIVRTAHDQMRAEHLKGPAGWLLGALNAVARLYLTVIRGTPTLVQLLLLFFVFMVNCNSKLVVAIVAFGINSGAYEAEIFRSGIMSIEKGQMEAGRSLGLGYAKTMRLIILPQAVKNTLPALVNEIITLLKETSICGYIGLNDLTRGGDIIRGTTFDAMLPLLTVALIYLVIVMFFTWVMSQIESRLRQSDTH